MKVYSQIQMSQIDEYASNDKDESNDSVPNLQITYR